MTGGFADFGDIRSVDWFGLQMILVIPRLFVFTGITQVTERSRPITAALP
jgi:hypothetical protein